MNMHDICNRLDMLIPNSEPLVTLVVKEYPAHFFAFWRMRLKQKNPSLSITVLDHATITVAALQQQLETSFLGMRTYYWLGIIPTPTTAEGARLLEYLFQYRGPNTVIAIFNDAAQLRGRYYTEVPATIAVQGLSQIAPYVGVSTASVQKLMTHIVGFGDQLALDSALLLLQYAHVLGTNSERFCAEWAPHILSLPVSLFLLSQYFFAKKSNLFFSCWQRVMHEYSDAFWTTYWSEQLWRAAIYCALKQDKKESEAKHISYRLPFSFINTDWRNYTIDECKKAHQFLYAYDHHLKTHTAVANFELFYAKFFTHQFANTVKKY